MVSIPQNNLNLRIVVLMGGASHEREISLESGRNVVFKLSHTYTVIPVFVTKNFEFFKITHTELACNSTEEIFHQLNPSQKILWQDLPHIADFVFIALHGAPGENGCVQGALEMLDMPYNGSGIFASALCMDKYKTNQFLKLQGFDTPRNFLLDQKIWKQYSPEKFWEFITNQLDTQKVIVKPHDDGCSVLVSKAVNSTELTEAINQIFNDKKQYALIEEYISGAELTVGIIGNNIPHALVPSQAISAAGVLSIEEKFLPGAGENQTPAPLPTDTLTRIQQTIERAYQVIGCQGYARVDCFYTQERVVFLEFNTLPALTPATVIFHQAAELGLKPSEFLDIIIALGLQAHRRNSLINAVPSNPVLRAVVGQPPHPAHTDHAHAQTAPLG